jgi:hypothetical protein
MFSSIVFRLSFVRAMPVCGVADESCSAWTWVERTVHDHRMMASRGAAAIRFFISDLLVTVVTRNNTIIANRPPVLESLRSLLSG